MVAKLKYYRMSENVTGKQYSIANDVYIPPTNTKYVFCDKCGEKIGDPIYTSNLTIHTSSDVWGDFMFLSTSMWHEKVIVAENVIEIIKKNNIKGVKGIIPIQIGGVDQIITKKEPPKYYELMLFDYGEIDDIYCKYESIHDCSNYSYNIKCINRSIALDEERINKNDIFSLMNGRYGIIISDKFVDNILVKNNLNSVLVKGIRGAFNLRSKNEYIYDGGFAHVRKKGKREE